MNPEKKQKIKKWIKIHQEEILYSTVFVSVTGAVIALGVAAVKEQNKAIEAYNTWATSVNNWLNEEEETGNDVYLLADQSFLTIPKDSPAKRVIK